MLCALAELAAQDGNVPWHEIGHANVEESAQQPRRNADPENGLVQGVAYGNEPGDQRGKRCLEDRFMMPSSWLILLCFCCHALLAWPEDLGQLAGL